MHPPRHQKDALSITDVMAAQGMTQNWAEMGFSAFLGKMGINNERQGAGNRITGRLCIKSVRSRGGVKQNFRQK
ncbi:antitermination protein [Escherichia coli]